MQGQVVLVASPFRKVVLKPVLVCNQQLVYSDCIHDVFE